MQHLSWWSASFSLRGSRHGFAPRAVHVRSVDEKCRRTDFFQTNSAFLSHIPSVLHIHALASERRTMDSTEAAVPGAIVSKPPQESATRLQISLLLILGDTSRNLAPTWHIVSSDLDLWISLLLNLEDSRWQQCYAVSTQWHNFYVVHTGRDKNLSFFLVFFWPCVMNWLYINFQLDALIIIYLQNTVLLYMFRASSAHLQEDIVVHKQHMVPSLSIRVLVACR